MRDEIRKRLRETVGQVAELRNQIVALEQQLDHGRIALAQAIGAREVLAEMFLPDGIPLSKAWEEDLDGLRTGGTPVQK